MALLSVKGLSVEFPGEGGRRAVIDDISFDVERGTAFGIVGESGSGKTMTSLAVLGIVPPPGVVTNGRIMFEGRDLMRADDEEKRHLRGWRIATVFQEPSSALDPVMTIGRQIAEAAAAHRDISKPKTRALSISALERVHIDDPERVAASYPHQLSGGTKQRSLIAMALVNEPDLLILDEPTTALDVTIQARILDLLCEIRSSRKLTILIVSHDLGVISRMCTSVAVMRKGRIVESGTVGQIIKTPKDPYTVRLIEAVRSFA